MGSGVGAGIGIVGSSSLAVALVVCLCASAWGQGEPVRRTYVLGLKDRAQRTPEGAEALAERVRARLVAAQLTEFDFRVDRSHGELKVEVTSELSEPQLRALLVGRGALSVAAAGYDEGLLSDLVDQLPEGVELVWGRRDGKPDVYLHSATRGPLEAFVGQVALGSHQVLIGPMAPDAGEPGWRTWLVSRGTPRLGPSGLSAVRLGSGVFPNYHTVHAYWSDVQDSSSKGVLAGASGLRALSEASAPGLLLIVVDGRVEATARAVRGLEEGRLTVRLPVGSAAEQRVSARMVAGWFAGQEHPCEVLVIFTGE